MPILAARGVSLIELLVVLFIMGIMMGMLLPALNGVRNQAQAKVCENNIRQLGMALQRAIEAKKKFPAPGQWTFDVLPYTEQVQLHFLLKQNREVDPKFPRPPLLRCPMQEQVLSRVDSVGPCHYTLRWWSIACPTATWDEAGKSRTFRCCPTIPLPSRGTRPPKFLTHCKTFISRRSPDRIRPVCT